MNSPNVSDVSFFYPLCFINKKISQCQLFFCICCYATDSINIQFNIAKNGK